MPSGQKHVAISASQRQSLRQHAQNHHHLTQKQLQEWFLNQFQRVITQPSISESLSSKYSHLDSEELLNSSSKRRKLVQWPELEVALFQWIQRIERDIPISGDLIKTQAAVFWKRLPMYSRKDLPIFSNGWLQGFKKRHNLKERSRHGEAGSIAHSVIEEQMTGIRAILQHAQKEDVYNCDETGLFYKLVPERGISSTAISGLKADKARLTLHFCCNSNGSHMLPPWFIGKASNPRCFGRAKVHLSSLNCVWKSNKSAWMTGFIFKEWLQWFDLQMAGRSVYLVMDNFTAHQLGYELIQTSGRPLQNTTVIWLPANSTAKVQPLDQGIIASFKGHYRKKWLSYMLSDFEKERNPLKTMNVLKAVRWSIQAWQTITPLTVTNCWIHSTVLQRSSINLPPLEVDLRPEIQQLQQLQRIQDAMSIQAFLNPAFEEVFDKEGDIEEEIIQQFIQEEPEEEDSEEEPEVLPRITFLQAIEALNTVRLFELQSEQGNHLAIQWMDSHENSIKERRTQSLQQANIHDFFI